MQADETNIYFSSFDLILWWSVVIRFELLRWRNSLQYLCTQWASGAAQMENLGNSFGDTHDHFLTGSHQRMTGHALIHCATASWSHENSVYAWLIPLQTWLANFNIPVLIITFCDVRCSASDVSHTFIHVLHSNTVKLALSLFSLGFIFSPSQSVGALPATVFFCLLLSDDCLYF